MNQNSADVLNAECRARAVLVILAEKWALLVIDALDAGPVRTGDLRRRIGGISEKMLIQTLRRLQSLDLVSRVDHHEVPPRVDYALTERGRSLRPIVHDLDRWVEANAFEIFPADGAIARENSMPSAEPLQHRPS